MKEDLKNQQNQDQSDDTDSEEILSRVGRIPFKWYENFKHFGYDINAQKITKQQQDDKIQEFIDRSENKNWWRTIKDELNSKNIVLTDDQLQMIDRIRKGKYADPNISKQDYSFEYDWNEGMFPLSAAPVSKKSFLPSKYERIMINKFVQAIQMGRITLKKDNEVKQEIITDCWDQENISQKQILPHIAAPKLSLPGHAESYNPSDEFLLDEQEKKELLEQDEEDRPINFIPQKHQNLRQVGAYEKFINERFDRCLDLYLCPRMRKKRLNMDAEQLLPKLPKPQELRPFPTNPTIYFEGHKKRIRSIALEKTGQFIASADEQGVLIIFETSTSRQQQKIKLESSIFSIDWSQNGILIVGTQNCIYIIIPNCIENFDDELFKKSKTNYKQENNLEWVFYEQGSDEYEQGFRIKINSNDNDIKQVVFHSKGDYFASVAPKAEKKNEQIFVHSILKGESQKPFQKSKGDIQKVLFHPKKPFFFLVTNKNTYIYNLSQQSMSKKLISGAQINSCIAIHPQGDNIIVGTHDRRVCWFDLDLQNTPYKTLRYHSRSIREVQFHQKYPLFASCSDDGTINIFHQMVYNDLMQNALIVPLKVLKGHDIKDDLGILDIKFHPTQPWIFSAGADHKLILWT